MQLTYKDKAVVEFRKKKRNVGAHSKIHYDSCAQRVWKVAGVDNVVFASKGALVLSVFVIRVLTTMSIQL